MKIFMRPGTTVMIGILVLSLALVGIVVKAQQNGMDIQQDKNWQQILKEENNALKQQMVKSRTDSEQQYFKKEIAINDYRIKHNMPPKEKYTVWSFVKDSSQLILLAGVFIIIVSAGIVASEFNWGTIKLLLIRPINR